MIEKQLTKTVMVHLAKLPPNEQEKVLSLTPREMQVLGLLARPLSYKDIARELNISPYTARAHSRSLMQKLGVGSKVDMLLWAQKANLLEKEKMVNK